jgi:hypothetical protein
MLLRFLAAIVASALVAAAAAAAQEPPPDEIAPPPPPTTPADPVEPAEPDGPTSITITVPPLPATKSAPKKAAPKAKRVEPAPEPARRWTPRRSAPVDVEPSVSETQGEIEAPAAETPPAKKAAPKSKAKPARKVHRPRPHAVAAAPARPRAIPDREAAASVLAAQFTLERADGGRANTGMIVLALVLAAALGLVVGVVGAAPVLADRWPKVFVPVIDATDRVVLAGLCVAGAAVTLVITWALTGPGS